MPAILVIIGIVIWYWWPTDSVDTQSASYAAGEDAGYQRGYYDGTGSVCRRLDATAPAIANDYRRRNFC
jgi:hypothetical protein